MTLSVTKMQKPVSSRKTLETGLNAGKTIEEKRVDAMF
jgi:hypothetical protein